LDKIIVQGGHKLQGKVRISASKNAVLPIIAASLLAEDEVCLTDIPPLQDVETICEVLKSIGVSIRRCGGQLYINSGGLATVEAPQHLARRMRASFLTVGPLLARLGQSRIALPGGCAIGTRPIDLHLKGFAALGAQVELGHGTIALQAPRLRGAVIYLDYPSVGATENIMMAACLAEGTTIIENAAGEPEVVDLANFLTALGAKVRGAGTNLIKIDGVARLGGARYTVIPDRIEAGTFLLAAAITGGHLLLENVLPEHLKPLLAKLRETGADVREDTNRLEIACPFPPRAVDVKTMPHPGFPTDMQAPMMAMLTVADGTSIITETVFENRFMHVDELKRMGADIKIEGRSAVVRGVDRLTGAPVAASDLRAGAALVVAGLAAKGITEVSGVGHLDRGYADLEKKLRAVGARIERRHA
jgi:UDP-N-acetylglucosamine 1-carboxyvinyltransferase